jgi:ketosteroid isomerase-like protein
MRRLLLGLSLFVVSADPISDRNELLNADRALAAATAAAGMTGAFVPALTDDAAYLHPGARLLRGRPAIRAFFANAAPLGGLTWVPAYADVSADGTLGYTYGWTRFGWGRYDGRKQQGKYLACWRKTDGSWRVSAYVRSVPVVDSAPPPQPRNPDPAAPIGGAADPAELLRVDSAFAQASVARGAKAAFLAFAADEAIGFGGGKEINQGREAIGAGFDNFPAGAVLEWTPVGADIAQSGDLGCTVGEASIASRRYYSKYLTVWKRQADGIWKFVADGGNVRPVPDSTSTGTPPPED